MGEVTPALREAAESKLGKSLERYEALLQSTCFRLKVEFRGGGKHDTTHKGQEAHIAEITALCKDKQVIRASSASTRRRARTASGGMARRTRPQSSPMMPSA